MSNPNPANGCEVSEDHSAFLLDLQETFDVSGLRLWWIRWLLPARAKRRGDGIFFPTVYDQAAVPPQNTNLHRKRLSAEVLIQHDWQAA